KEAFDESNLSIRVDIVDWAATSEEFRKIIEQNKVIVQKGKEGSEAIGSEWILTSIDELKASTPGSIAIGPFGSRMKSDCYVPIGVRVVRGTNLMEGRKFSGEFVFITEDKAKELGSSNLQPNDIVFPHRGSIGEVGIVPDDGKHYVLSSSLMKLSCDTTKAAPLFIYYFFKSSLGRFELLKNASQVGTPGIGQPLTSLKAIKLRLPPIKEQLEIVSILAGLDDRIDLLRETNATLEAIAQALFKSWFVDFDPVHAKQQGREPEGMDADTAALFPYSFEESELGLIPQGWNICSFAETIDIIGGGTPKTAISEYWNGEIPWFSVVDAPKTTDVFVIDTEKHITQAGLEKSSTKLLSVGTTIISARGTVGRLALVGQEMAMNQSCYGLRGKAGDDFFTYLSTYRLIETLKQRTHGSVFDTITRDTLAGVNVIYPNKSVISAFENLLSPLMERIKENLKQAQTLTTLRDTLLPRLISGQLRLSDAEALIEETV
ncbi:MAG: restriction endonuclease subunit S, partial [Methylobacter sp.]